MMKPARQTLTLMLFCLVFPATSLGQKSQIKIENRPNTAAVPGQMLQLHVSGVGERMFAPLPADRFEVLVTQNEVTHRARIRSVTTVMVARSLDAPPPSKEENSNRAARGDQRLSEPKQYDGVLFTVPQGLSEGDATVVVVYRGRRSDEFKFRIVSQPPTPQIFASRTFTSFSSRPAFPRPGQMKDSAPRGLSFERGRETPITVVPLLDPEVPETKVLVTFKQGNFSKEVTAKVKRFDPEEERSGPATVIGPPHYEVTVGTPEELAPGPVELEVRLVAGGQTSEPGSARGVIIDPSAPSVNPEAVRPQITNLSVSRIGIGQAFQLSVADVRALEPEPLKTLIILEQDSRRVELKPEMNSAAFARDRSPLNPVVLAVRVGEDVTGKVVVRVYNPLRGEDAGMSEGVPLEIADDVLAPQVKRVSEAGKQDIATLNALREQVLKSGGEFKEYDPIFRYVTVQAEGLDYHPNFVRIEFEQDGRRYTLKYEDLSLFTGDRLVVRLPEGINPGPVQVIIQNLTAGRMSEAVTRTVEITQPSRTR